MKHNDMTLVLVGFMLVFLACPGSDAFAQNEPPASETPTVGQPTVGQWTGGAAVGFLANTPDDTAFAANLNIERFMTQNFSLGPLLQIATTGDMTMIGFSGQGKYWIDLPNTDNRGRLNLQAGIGFVHADFRADDTSWLIPIGIGFDYQLNRTIALTTTFLINFTDLHTGGGTDAHVMPGLTFGVRF
jgi:hypothetical protein